MPIDISSYATPKFTRYIEKQPFEIGPTSKYMVFADYPRSYRGGDFPQSGYNPHNGLVAPKRVNINNEDLTLLPY